MRNPNGYGTVVKLSGKRRRPFVARVSEWEIVPDPLPTEPAKRLKQKCIGYYETRSDAMIALADYNKNPYDIDRRNITLGEVCSIIAESKIDKKTSSTKRGYDASLQKIRPIEHIRMKELRKSHMQSIIDAYSDKSAGTQKNLIKLFHLVGEYSLENDIIEKDYSQFLEVTSSQKPKAKKIFTLDEIKIVMSSTGIIADTIKVLLYTGMRINELLQLKTEQIDLNARIINLHGTKTKNAVRIVPIHKDIIPIIEKHINQNWLFEIDFKQIEYNKYRFLYKSFCDEIGASHSIHETRHTFVSQATACKLNQVYIGKIVGHSSGDLTIDTYTHTIEEILVQEIDKFCY